MEAFNSLERNAGEIGEHRVGVGDVVRHLAEGIPGTAGVGGILVDQQCAAAPRGTAVAVFAAFVDHDPVALVQSGRVAALFDDDAHVLIPGNQRIVTLFRVLHAMVGLHIGAGADRAERRSLPE